MRCNESLDTNNLSNFREKIQLNLLLQIWSLDIQRFNFNIKYQFCSRSITNWRNFITRISSHLFSSFMFVNLIFFVTFLQHIRIFCHKIFNIFNTMNIKSFYYILQINQGKLKFRLIFFPLLCCKFSWNFSCKFFFLLLLLPCLY